MPAGFSRNWLTTVKIAVLTPIPSARVAMATAVKAGVLPSVRPARRNSFQRASITDQYWRMGGKVAENFAGWGKPGLWPARRCKCGAELRLRGGASRAASSGGPRRTAAELELRPTKKLQD